MLPVALKIEFVVNGKKLLAWNTDPGYLLDMSQNPRSLPPQSTSSMTSSIRSMISLWCWWCWWSCPPWLWVASNRFSRFVLELWLLPWLPESLNFSAKNLLKLNEKMDKFSANNTLHLNEKNGKDDLKVWIFAPKMVTMIMMIMVSEMETFWIGTTFVLRSVKSPRGQRIVKPWLRVRR